METRANYFIIGSFVLALLAGLFVFLLWFAKYNDSKEYVKYYIYFRESVAGLNTGGLVRYRGIQVGKILDIGIDPNNVEQAKVFIEISSDTPVKTDTVATLKYQGITGIGYIELKGGTQEAPPLLPAGQESCATIPSEQSQLEQLFESAPDLITAYTKVAEKADKLLSDQNIQAFSETVSNMRDFSQAFAGNKKQIDTLINRSAAVAANMDRITQSLGKNLPATLEQSRSAATALAGILTDSRAPVSNFAHSGLSEMQLLLSDTRRTLEDIKSLSGTLKENPSQLIFSRERQGVTIP